jgi:hypothetical protein
MLAAVLILRDFAFHAFEVIVLQLILSFHSQYESNVLDFFLSVHRYASLPPNMLFLVLEVL